MPLPLERTDTTVAASSSGHGTNLDVVQDVLYGREVDVVTVEDEGPEESARQIIEQSKLGYGVIAVGATARSGRARFVSPMVNELLKHSDLPVVIVRRARNLEGRLPGIFAQALVPVVASPSSRAAQELAANLSSRLGTRLMLSHVVYDAGGRVEVGRRLIGRLLSAAPPAETGVAERILAQAHEHALQVNANVDTEIRLASSPAVEMVRRASEIDADLIVLGARLRRLDDGRPSLGPTVEHVLEHASQTVVAVITPDDRPS